MRIFFACPDSPNWEIPSSLWRNNLYLPLLDLGHEVLRFEYDLTETYRYLDPDKPTDRAFIARNRPSLSRELLRQLGAAHAARPIDLFFSYFYDACVLPESIRAINALGCTTVNWYCNGSYQLHLVREISPEYNWCLVPEKARLSDYRNMGARPLYCQEAANPTFYKPHDVPQVFDVTFIGQAYGERPAYLRHLIDNRIDVRAWGASWKLHAAREQPQETAPLFASCVASTRALLGAAVSLRRPSSPQQITLPAQMLGDPLSDEEMVRTYSRSKINLGFSTCGDTHTADKPIKQVRLRDFEVPMSGGFYMVEYMEELEEFFDIGREVVCYDSPDDLVDKIRYYLSHPEEREAIRKAGYERCRRDHSWHRRFEQAFQQMGLA